MYDLTVTDAGCYFANGVLTHNSRRHPQRFVLVRPQDGLGGNPKNWLLMNTTPRDPLSFEKTRYKSIPAEKVEPLLDNLQPGSSVQAKIDGALTLTHLLKDKIDLLSYRQSKVHGGPILHSERVWKTIPEVTIPKPYQNSVLSGELYATSKGKPYDPQALGGLLNSSIAKSLQDQESNDVRFGNQVFDIRRQGGKEIDTSVPYEERLAKVRAILQSLGGRDAEAVRAVYHTPEEAKTPVEAKQLYSQVMSGQHPMTTEGIVIHPPTGAPMKSKLVNEHNVVLKSIFPGKGKYQDNAAGGFIYSHPGENHISGEVGTGISDQLRRDMFNDPQAYIGRTARVRATRKLRSGALFQPSFLAMDETRSPVAVPEMGV